MAIDGHFMKIVADENIPFVHEFFDCFGDVVTAPGRQLTAAQVRDADILLVRSVTQVNETLLAGSQVRFVGTCTIGTDHLDTAYLNATRVTYASAPGCNAGGVLQYDLAALTYLDPRWNEKKIGIIGHGNVGGRVAEVLQRLGVQLCAYDPFLNAAEIPYLTGLDQVLASDIICMHTPYTRGGKHATHHLIGAGELQSLHDHAILLNAGRGGAIDNQALKRHLRRKPDLRVVLDVWEDEPNIDVELLDRVALATPHIAGYSFEGKLNGSAMIFEALVRYLGEDEMRYRHHLDELLARLKGNPLPLEVGSVQEAVQHTYDIADDDLRTRSAITTTHESDRGGAFDALRKHYPERREFGHYYSSGHDETLRGMLTALGFLAHD